MSARGFDLGAIVARALPPEPWAEGEKIPWDDPAFSERMLREHLSQLHDAASRRMEVIEAQVAWLHETLLGGEPGRVLDLGCGPGLYTHRLAQLGHHVRGIDLSPASIRHARDAAARDGIEVEYIEGDMRDVGLGQDHDLALLSYGELNVLRREDAAAILAKTRIALERAPRGRVTP